MVQPARPSDVGRVAFIAGLLFLLVASLLINRSALFVIFYLSSFSQILPQQGSDIKR